MILQHFINIIGNLKKCDIDDFKFSKSGAPCGHGGSSPPFGTMKDSEQSPVISEQ